MTRMLGALALALVPLAARADTCHQMEHAEAKSANGRYVFRMDQSGGWQGRLEDTKSGKVASGPLAGLGDHLHSTAFVTDDGSRVVVFESRVPQYKGGVLVVYDDSLKLLKSFSFEDLLNETDRKATSRSISHYQFLANKRDGKRPYGLDPGEKTFSMLLKTKRSAIVSLVEPKIIPTPEVLPEVFEFEDGPPPGKTDTERFQRVWMSTGGRSGVLVNDFEIYRETPRYYTFAGDKIRIPDCRFDNYTFRLDESVTPHAIDLTPPGKTEPIRGIYEFRGGKLLICTPDGPKDPRPRTLDAQGFGVKDWTETLQRRKAK